MYAGRNTSLNPPHVMVLVWFAVLLAALALPGLLQAQERESRRDTLDSRARYTLKPLVVTATREPRQSFELAAPVVALDSSSIRRLAPNTAADLLRDLPGLDVSGVGPSCVRQSKT